jgi:hypothetical protein
MSLKVRDSISVPEMAAPATPPSGEMEIYAKSDGRLYARNDVGTEYDLTSGPGNTIINGVQTLLHMDATATSEIVSSTAESAARKTYTLPANDYDHVIVEFGVQQRVEQDATTRCDFTWRIKVGGSTERTYIERVIAMNTTNVDSGGRRQTVLMHRLAGGQVSPTNITITSQHSLSNAATGSIVQWMRVYGVKDYVIVGEQGPAGPSLTNFAESVHTSSPNNTINASRLLTVAGSTNADFVASPKGSGAFQLHLADNTTAGGNKRGANAVDLQMVRSNANQVASGTGSFAAGGSNRVTGVYSAALGFSNSVFGDQSFAIGLSNTVNDFRSCTLVVGSNQTARRSSTLQFGEYAQAANVQSSAYRETTNATPIVMQVCGGSVVPMADDSSIAFSVYIIARNVATDTQSKAWRVEGAMRRGDGAATTTLVGTPVVTGLGEDTGTSSWGVEAIADTSQGGLALRVTGEAAKTIRWAAKVDIAEVIG